MAEQSDFDAWTAGQSYEHYMGRWSRRIAAKFVDWLAPAPGADWLEIGCGTGALTQTILTAAVPRSLLATDQSADFVAHAQEQNKNPRAAFGVATAARLPAKDSSADIVTSALVMNFIPDQQAALAEMRRVLRPDGCVAFYVWDYPGGGMGFIDAFWKAAAEIDPNAAALDESARFPSCQPKDLSRICTAAGLCEVEVVAIEVETRFPDFEAFWHPFTLGAGPAPGYCKSLPKARQQQLKQRLSSKFGASGPVALPARAWAVKARSPAAS